MICRDHVAQLRQNRALFDKLHTKILLVSFIDGHWLDMWLKDMDHPFPMLVDTERKAYHAYGLKHSILGVWNLHSALDGAKRLFTGRKLSRIGRGDPNQLGGDFIIDPQGIVRFIHISTNPTDRPSIHQLLDVLQTS